MSFSFFKDKLISFSCFSRFITIILITTFSCGNIHAAIFEVQNNCSYTVWAAANPGGGRELSQGQTWIFNTDPNFSDTGSIWARTNCNFHADGTTACDSGDCDGALYCVSSGSPPVTLAEYGFRQVNNMDFFDISLMDGFNVPMEFKGASSGCTKQIKCTGDINGLCPTELRHPGGCNHPCTAFKNDQFCCTSGGGCTGATPYVQFFKDFCPDVYTYPLDDAAGTFTCPNGTDYKVVFCPSP